MIQHHFNQTMLSLMLLLASVSACTKSDPVPTVKLVDTLPEVVGSVNGVKIARATILERFDQALSMQAHSQHMSQMSPPASQDSAQSAPASTTAPDPGAMHAQHNSDSDEKGILRSIINQLVLEQLKLQEVERLGLSVSPEVLDENIKLIEKQAGSREALEEQLRQGHATVEQWRTQLRQALLFQRLAEQRRKALPVSDEDIRQYWKQNGQALSKIWKTDRVDPVQDRVRSLLQQAHWPKAEAEWHNELVKNAKIWIDPVVRQQFANPTDHSHPEQGAHAKSAKAVQG